MVRGEKGGSKRDLKRRVKGNEGSDDSDEDYVAPNDQSDASEDALEDLARSASEDEIFNDEALTEDEGINDDDYKEEEEEDEEGKDEEEEEKEELEEDGGGEDEEEDEVVKAEVKWGSSGQRKSMNKISRKRNAVILKEEEDDDDEDYDGTDDDDADDEEFTLDEVECLEDQEDFAVKKRSRSKVETQKKTGRRGVRKKLAKSGRKRRKKFAAPKSLSRKRGRKINPTRKKARYEGEYEEEDNGGFEDKNMERARKTGKRRSTVRSDSDSMSSGSSDYEITMSEEEREQVREAKEFCGYRTDIPTRRSSSSSEKRTKSGYLRSRREAPSKRTEEKVGLPQQRNPSGPKGKQKVEEVNMKQVCGICLSEEDKRRVRGTLNCCSHYFCFSCILEWSKVETRCPLCKQRFKTISKPAKSAAGVDLRDSVTQVQERDQVYQPTEEEIRGYLDPYENVICTECQQGGDDGLMLLCDLCDSPAHTYCVGLGREVPEGNWYCEGCRPGAIGSSSSQPEDSFFTDQRAGMNGGDGLDLNVAPSSLPFTQGVGGLVSPRFNGVINQAAYPSPGSGATTLYDRRARLLHIQGLLTGNISNTMSPRTYWVSPVHAGSDQLSRHDQPRQAPMHHWRTPETRASCESIFGERLQETPSPSMRSRNHFFLRQSTLRRQGVQEPTANPPSNSLGAISVNELGVMDGAIVAHEPFPQSINSRSSLGSEFTASPLALREESHFYRAKEQVQSMVRSHLKSISKDGLGPDDFKDIVKSSTHAILAACGLDHRKIEVHTGLVPPPLGCTHPEIAASGPASLIKGLCSACFDGYVREVVESVMKTRSQQWLSLCL